MKITKTQQRLLAAIPQGGRVRYWAPNGFNGGRFRILDAMGEYTNTEFDGGRRIPHSTIETLVKKGALRCVRRFAANATETEKGQNTGREYETVADV